MKKFLTTTVSILFWIAVWAIAAASIDSSLLLPSPLSVFQKALSLMQDAQFWHILLLSLTRILTGIAVSMLVSILLAVLSALSEAFRILVAPLMGVMKSTPVASFIILALLWMSRDTLPIFITELIVIPTLYSNIYGGIKNTDPKLVELAKSYKLSACLRIKRLYIPSVYPYFLSGCKSSLGLAWKAGIAAEVIALPTLSIGKKIYESKMYLEMTDLFAWTLVVILLSFFIEYVLTSLLNLLGKRGVDKC